MKCHFFDIDAIIKVNSKPWIIDRLNPTIPIMKIENYEFNIFKSGIYKSQNNKLNFNGKDFWLSNEFFNSLKVRCKKMKIDISNLAISMREFLDSDITDNIDFSIDIKFFNNIINTNDDIYIICSKQNKNSYKKQIEQIEKKLFEIGLAINNYYFISETFFNKDDDEISFTKTKLIIQHLLGLKANDKVITSEEIKKYDEIYIYDTNKKAIETFKNINHIINILLSKSDIKAKLLSKERIKENDLLIKVIEVTDNKVNKSIETIVTIEFSNLIKKFEVFNPSFSELPI